MTDKNNVEMKTGDIVEIKNAYFKNDNGIYFVAHTPGDASWSGHDHSLNKMCKNGTLSTANHNLAFWPLVSFTNNRAKNAECREWNAEHATIEVIYNIDNQYVVERFKKEAEGERIQAEHYSRIYGDDASHTQLTRSIYNLYASVVERMQSNGATATADPVEEVEEPSIYTQQAQTETAAEPPAFERKYFPINESLAKSARGMWSFSDYSQGSTTSDYINSVNTAYEIVAKIADIKPERLLEALAVTERYSRKYAEWINKGNSIELQCPSVMICGAGNFPVRKKEKQNRSRDNHMKELDYINGYLKKLDSILYGQEIIKSADSEAVSKLQEKLAELERLQAVMKQANAYYKTNNTLQGFTDLKQSEIDSIMNFMKRNPYYKRPFEGFSPTNNNAKINNIKDRIAQLQKAKTNGTHETIKTDICKVIENAEVMRIQLIFDGKPSDQIRTILKSNGFIWAPSQGAWQRQLTNNARYSTKQVLEQIKNIA